jgi:hypothetical protein
MTRNLKALGLVFLSILALGAVIAAGAQATEAKFEVSEGTVHGEVTADPDDPTQIFEVTPGIEFTCDEVSATVDLPQNGGTTVTATELTYDDSGTAEPDTCTGPFGTEPAIEVNGCDYTFHAGTTLAAGESTGTVDINCPEENTIVANGGFLCTAYVGSQEGLSHVIYRNTVTNSHETVTVEATVENIHVFHEGLCGEATTTGGFYEGKATVRGTNSGGGTTDITVADL